MFLQNSYPASFFDNVLQKFLRNADLSNSMTTSDIVNPEDVNDSLPSVIFRVPYLGKCSVDFAKRVSRCVAREFPVTVRIVYSTFKVRSYFNLKCFSPSYLSSNVVYKYECMSESCTDSYIGFTTRHLFERVEEHTARERKGQSEVKDHLKTCLVCKQNNVNHAHFTVVRRCRSETQCKLHEAFNIKRFRPVLNKQMLQRGQVKSYMCGSDYFLRLLFSCFPNY